jgi:ATP-dependent DNA helicase RecG
MTEASHDAARARLQVLVESTDGFRIAEADLALRGPGDLLGKRQHGIPDFRAANLGTDLDLVAAAHTDAGTILDRDPLLRSPEFRALGDAIRRRFCGSEFLVDSGSA